MTLDDAERPADTRSGGSRDPSTSSLIFRFRARTDAVLDSIGLGTSFARDCLLAVLVAFVSVGMFWMLLGLVASAEGIVFAPAAKAALTVLMCVQSLALCVRRSKVLLCFFTVVSAQVAIIAFLPADAYFQGLAPFIASYTCGCLLSVRRLSWALAGATILQTGGGLVLAAASLVPTPPATIALSPSYQGLVLLVSALGVYVVSAFIGNYVATRRMYVRLVRLRAAEAVEAQRERANGAARAERTRMARELHDIAAHHLSGMVVQAGAAERLIGKDEAAAKEAMAWIRSQGKDTLHNLRLVVGALRDPGEHPYAPGAPLERNGEPHMGGAPVPGIAIIERLVQDERALGAAINLVRIGEPCDLPPVADVTFYRVAQEALSNVREHASGAQVHVVLRYEESEVMLQVENRPGTGSATEAEGMKSPRSTRGLGLVGMKERARLIGAVLEAGAGESGGWLVRLTLPFTREIAANGAGTGPLDSEG